MQTYPNIICNSSLYVFNVSVCFDLLSLAQRRWTCFFIQRRELHALTLRSFTDFICTNTIHNGFICIYALVSQINRWNHHIDSVLLLLLLLFSKPNFRVATLIRDMNASTVAMKQQHFNKVMHINFKQFFRGDFVETFNPVKKSM